MSLDPAQVFVLAADHGPRTVLLDGFLGDSAARRALEGARTLDASDQLRPARMGRDGTAWASSLLRGDRIAWLTSTPRDALPQGIAHALHELESLRDRLREKAPWLNLGTRISVQLACYPGNGEGYVRHMDTFEPRKAAVAHENAGVSSSTHKSIRKITALYYLNPDWSEDHGGKLRTYYHSDNPTQNSAISCTANELQWDIAPVLDRLVLFRSDIVPHEVLPSKMTRYALTCWMYTSDSAEPSASSESTPAQPKSSQTPTNAITTSRHSQLPQQSTPQMYSTKFSHYPVCHGLRMLDPDARSLWGDAARSAKPNTSAGATNSNVAHTILDYKAKPLPGVGGSSSAPLTCTHTHRIFVSIASYRDPECQHTLKSVFAAANHPDRVHVGICFQYDYDYDKGCFDSMQPMVRPDQVRVMHVDSKDACGPCWARHLTETLFQWDYKDENTYILQLDSHMRLRPGWDDYLISCLKRCPSAKPVITAYPLGYELPNDVPAEDVDATLLCAERFDDDGMLRIKGRRIISSQLQEDPIPSLFWASGFSFARAALMFECPYDPNLPHLFFGEETSMLARMWTHGWDMFTPTTAVVYHLWTRSYRPTVRENFSRDEGTASNMRKQSQDRVRRLLNGDCSCGESPDANKNTKISDPFGLGTVRSLKEFQEFCGVDFCAEAITERARKGGQPHHCFKAQNAVAQGSSMSTVSAPSAAAQVFQLLQMKGLLE